MSSLLSSCSSSDVAAAAPSLLARSPSFRHHYLSHHYRGSYLFARRVLRNKPHLTTSKESSHFLLVYKVCQVFRSLALILPSSKVSPCLHQHQGDLSSTVT